MSKPASNPFFETDYTKMMDVSKMMDGFKSPVVDMEAVVGSLRRNLETVTAVNQAAWECWQGMARRQSEWLRQNMEQMPNLMSSVMACPSPEEKLAKQAEVSKVAVDKCVANVRDFAETMTKTNCQALETVGNRISESLDEMRGLIKGNRAA